MTAERLQKVLAAAGVASRRQAETLIVAGRVSVNGVTVRELGSRADPAMDDVRVDGTAIRTPQRHTYLALYKPVGILTAVSDTRGRRTVIDLLPAGTPRVVPIGRLDLDSEGLLLLTDDGDLGLRLAHPRFGAEKEYVVVTDRPVPPESLAVLRTGVEIEGRQTAPAGVHAVTTARGLPVDRTYAVTLHEGRNRQVRRMFATQGIRIARLIRVRVGAVRLGDLASGAARPLSSRELVALGVAIPGAARQR